MLVLTVSHVALLANPAYPGQDNERSSSEATGGRIGLDVRYTPARTSDELAAAFAKMAADKVQAISVLADSFTVQNRDSIIAFGADRFDNSGTAFIGFWFFKDNVVPAADGRFRKGPLATDALSSHQLGDVLVLIEFSVGGSVATAKVFEWV